MKTSKNGSQTREMLINELGTLKREWMGIASKNSGMIANEFLFNRSQFGKSLLDPKERNYNKEFGYIEYPNIRHFKELYVSNAIAKRVIEVYPDECWATHPEIYETERKSKTAFEGSWNTFAEEVNPLGYLHRTDQQSRIGRFGGTLIGFDDNRGLDQPVPGILENDTKDVAVTQERKVLYLRVFDESQITIKSYNENPKSPRYWMPQTYQLQVMQPAMQETESSQVGKAQSIEVHWSRFHHVADNLTTNEIFGMEACRPILNQLCDIRKVLGSSAEMFYQGAFPGIAFETLPEMVDEGDLDVESLKKQIEMYQNKIRRYLLLEGVHANAMTPQVADPSNHILRNMEVICLAIACPVRVFMGSEAAHLASTQDRATWNGRLAKRQRLYLEPKVIDPFIDRLVKANVLLAPKKPRGWTVDWTDLNSQSDADRANVILKMTQALMQYVTGGCETVMPLERFLSLFMRLKPDEVSSVMELLQNPPTSLTEKVWSKALNKGAPQGGGRTGNAGADAGRPAGQTP